MLWNAPRQGKPDNGMTEKLTTYEPAEDLTSDEAVAVFITGAFETNDAGFIAYALGIAARAKGDRCVVSTAETQ